MAKRIVLNGLDCFMLPQKVLYIPDYRLLVVSDWHLGKLTHFRKEGIFIPPVQINEEIDRMELLLEELPVERVVLLGDLFHSEWNEDWRQFTFFIQRYPHISFVLTKGNHDILAIDHWREAKIKVVPQYVLKEGLVFSHEPQPDLPNYMINIVGHVHPGCLLKVKGRQSFRLPCFHLAERILTLPAYGKWTGVQVLPQVEGVRFFPIINDEVLEL